MTSGRILVTGASGQLGRCIRDVAGEDGFIYTDLPEMDVTDPDSVRKAVGMQGVRAVVNCAAFTDVNGAEGRPDDARRLNAEAPALLARACAGRGVRLLHLSTDYVFDGLKRTPYAEDDIPAPRSAYGCTKLAGERAVVASGADYVIIRTSWLYSEYGRNFVRTMLRLDGQGKEIAVVDDQKGSPTYAADLARFIVRLLNEAPEFKGTVHYAGSGSCSWYEFACSVLAGRRTSPRPCATDEYPSAVRRPAYSVLCTALAEKLCPGCTRPWREALKECLARIEETEK